ncbi:hypothetical protein HDU76_009634, partial [Blyttiomyces sp. JEL0837]
LTQSAVDLYGPLIERRQKAEKIKTTLSVLEQWKFFFNLPTSLKDSISRGNFDAAVRDYNKGKYLMSTSFATASALPDGAQFNSRMSYSLESYTKKPESSLLPAHYRQVFERVWEEVEKITVAFRERLFAHLSNSSQSIDVQERIMTHLIDLDASEDPVWFYLDHQYKWIINRLAGTYSDHLNRLNELKRGMEISMRLPPALMPLPKPRYRADLDMEMDEHDDDDIDGDGMGRRNFFSAVDDGFAVRKFGRFTQSQFRKAIAFVQTKSFDQTFVEDYDFQIWKTTMKTVRVLCKVMRECMQDFWKMCRIYSEDRIQKSKASDSEQPAPRTKRRADLRKMMQCQTMIRHIVEMYSTILSHLFHLETPLRTIKTLHRQGSMTSPASAAPPTAPAANIADSTTPQVVTTQPTTADTSSSMEPSTPISPTTGTHPPLPPKTPVGPSGNIVDPPAPLPPPPSIEFASALSAHPLTCCHWISRIMGELVRCFEEVRAMRIGGGTTIEERVLRCVGEAAESVKVRCIESICDGILYEARKFCEYEDWSFEPEQQAAADSNKDNDDGDSSISADATQNVKLFYRFQKSLLRCLHKISTAPVSANLPPAKEAGFGRQSNAATSLLLFSLDGNEPAILPVSSGKSTGGSGGGGSGGGSSSVPDPPAPSAIAPTPLVETIRSAFFEASLLFLDGQEWLATRWTVASAVTGSIVFHSHTQLNQIPHLTERKAEELAVPQFAKLANKDILTVAGETAGTRSAQAAQRGTEKRFKALDVTKIDSRCLIIISNLMYFKSSVLPKLVALLELKFKYHLTGDVKFLYETIDYLDAVLFNNYIRRKALKISGHVRSGILYSGIDWDSLQRPQDIRPYAHELLMLFVLAHAEVSDASKRIIKRVISELFHALARDLLMACRGVDRFGEVGAMQITLEIEYIHQILSSYETPSVAELFGLTYATIERACVKGRLDTVTPPPQPSTQTREDGDGSSSARASRSGAPAPLTREQLTENVKEILQRARESTALQFLCFNEEVDEAVRRRNEAEALEDRS